LPIDGRVWLAQRRNLLNQRLRGVERKLKRGQLEGGRIENGRLKITPHDPVTPPAGEQLDHAIDAVMPRIRITELLWDVGRTLAFSNLHRFALGAQQCHGALLASCARFGVG